MRSQSTIKAVLLSIGLLGLAACGTQRHQASASENTSYDSRDPGSVASPTNDESFQLMEADGPSRFAALQALIAGAGKRCSAVTKGVLEGGMDGTDEWRVNCADGGVWQLWLKDDGGIDVDPCKNSKCT